MFKPVPFFIGLRYTGAKRRNHFISFISLISVIGLLLGVAVLIVVLSVMNGFDRELQKRILGMVPHGLIIGQEAIAEWKPLAEQLKAYPGVTGAAPFTELQGMLTASGHVTGVLVHGIDPEYEPEVSILHEHLVAGELQDLAPGEFGIIPGYGIARKLGLVPGDKVTLVLPEASVSIAGVVPRFKRFTVMGIFKVGAEIDGSFAYVHYQDAARLLRKPGTVQGVRIRVADLFQAPMITHRIQQDLNFAYFTSDWTRTHGNLWQAIRMEKAMMALLLFFIVAVAAFNIMSSLVMLVTDKQADIAVLRTLGATPGTIMATFMVQGTLIGVFGVLGGVALGVVLALNISDIAAWIEQVTGAGLFDAYFVHFLPSELQLDDVLIVSLVAFAISFLATLYPAWRASRVQPAEALRYE